MITIANKALNIVLVPGVKAPMPYMRPDIAPFFNNLRQAVKDESGIDFLAICGDIFRMPDFVSGKDGVANRSWHKCAVTFDYNQDEKALVLVSEKIGGKQFFRTYLKCAKQDGSVGTKVKLADYRGSVFQGYAYDFTAAAARFGFNRIPAWGGWEKNYNRKEFWHYQKDDGLTWEAAMQQIQGVTATSIKSIGLNDRDSNTGGRVSQIEERLVFYKFLAPTEADGVFDADTHRAAIGFQKANGLKPDGVVGPKTLAKLGL